VFDGPFDLRKAGGSALRRYTAAHDREYYPTQNTTPSPCALCAVNTSAPLLFRWVTEPRMLICLSSQQGISSSLLIVRVAAASASRGSGANNTSRSLSRSLPNSDIRSAVAASSTPYGMGAGDVPLKVKVSVTHHHTHDHGTCDVDEDTDRKMVLGNGLDSSAGANAV
jgi:hypothetical protein